MTVLEFSRLSSSTVDRLNFSFLSTFDPLNQTHNAEIICNGGSGVQIDIVFTYNSSLSTPTMSVYEGRLKAEDDYGQISYVTICTQQPNATIELSSLETVQFLSTLASSVDFGAQQVEQHVVTLEAIDRFNRAIVQRENLFDDHVQAWLNLWRSGIDIEPIENETFFNEITYFDTDHNGENDTIIRTFARGLDIAQHVNSSMYYLLSSSRDDWP